MSGATDTRIERLDEGDFRGVIGAGIGAANKFLGSDDFETVLLPLIDIDEIKGGNLPRFLPLAGLVDFIDDEDKALNISVNLTAITFRDGEVTLNGAP